MFIRTLAIPRAVPSIPAGWVWPLALMGHLGTPCASEVLILAIAVGMSGHQLRFGVGDP